MKNSKAFQKALCSLVVTALVSTSTFISQSANVKADTNNYTLQIGQINPQLAKYLQNNQDSSGHIPLPIKFKNNQRPTGHIPLPIKFSSEATKSCKTATVLPAKYDLRTTNRVSPVRDQGQIGSCWACGAYGSLESWMLTNGLGQQDYSENNLITHHGFDFAADKGGNMLMATAYLSRWDGPVLEKDDPYANPPYPANIVVRNNLPIQKHIQDVVFIPDRTGPTDNAEIKNAVMQYGVIDTSMDYEDNYFNQSTNSFYNSNSSSSPNHDIGIVGWDDNYSRNNFATKPAGDGAFIIRNSWGTSWGDGGYFYVSYYDAFIGKDNAAFINAQPTDNFDKVYQYDPLGLVNNLGYNNSTAWFANVFKATGNDNLSATSFYTSKKAAQYEVYVETNYDANEFSKLTLVKSGTIDMPGYHTITFNNPVALTSGNNFAIAVKLVEAGETKPVPIESYESGYTSKGISSSLGQSFMSPDGKTWTDIMQSQPSLKANVCLKAFTKGGTTPVPANPTVTSTNPINGATGIDNTKPITVTFNDNVKAGSNFSGIKVIDSSSKAVTANCSINANVLTINATMAAGNKYTITIPVNAVVNGANKTTASEYTFSFSTVAPTPTGLSVVSTNPANGATDVSVYNTLTITFNSSSVKAGTNFKNIKVVDKYGSVKVSCYARGNSLRIYPTLDYDTTYTVTIPAGAIIDASGKALTKDYTFTFTTESDGDWNY